MKRILVFTALLLSFMGGPTAAAPIDTPLHFAQKFSGDQPLRFAAGGTRLTPKGGRLTYRVITKQNDWKKIWGYLYDDTVKVDFRKHRVLAIYKSPAKGGFRLVPKRVYLLDGSLSVTLDVIWDGKTKKSHPFVFLVVDRFSGLRVEENFVSPPNQKVRYP